MGSRSDAVVGLPGEGPFESWGDEGVLLPKHPKSKTVNGRRSRRIWEGLVGCFKVCPGYCWFPLG